MARRRPEQAFSLFAFQDIITAVTGILVLVMLILALVIAAREISEPTDRIVSASEAELRSEIEELKLKNSKLLSRIESYHQLAKLNASSSLDDLEVQYEKAIRERSQLESQQSRIQGKQRKIQESLDESKLAWKERSSDRDGLTRGKENLEDLLRQLKDIQERDRITFNFRSEENRVVWLIEVNSNRILLAQVGVSAAPREIKLGGLLRANGFEEWLERLDRNAVHLVFLVRSGAVRQFNQAYEMAKEKDFSVGVHVLDDETTVIDRNKGAAR